MVQMSSALIRTGTFFERSRRMSSNQVPTFSDQRRQYVIRSDCISCAACWRVVPEHFESHPVHAHAVVLRQPTTPSEFDRCEEARRICPVHAIRVLATGGA